MIAVSARASTGSHPRSIPTWTGTSIARSAELAERSRSGESGAAIAVVASIALAIVVGPRAIDALRTEQLPSPGASPTSTNPAVIAGTYETVVSSDQPAVRRYGLAGRWTIRLGTNGIMTVSAPRSFTGVLSGSLFHVKGDRFQTNLFVQDVCSNLPVATYQWVKKGSKLTFTSIDDACAGRVAVLYLGSMDARRMTAGKPLAAVPPVHRVMSRTAMWTRVIGAALVALAFATASCTGGGAKASFRPTLQWDKCPSDIEIQYFSRHRCGWLTVLQDRSQPAGKTVRLLVVQTWPVGETPVPGFNSGFGSDLGSGYGYGSTAAGSTRTHHIGFTLELRGTGHSEPSLACPEVDALDPRQARAPTGDSSLLESTSSRRSRACHDRLTAQGVVPADYDVQNVAQDMDDLRVALGIDRWAFLSSYGTNSRYLFEYLRAFPGRVGGAWMDSPQFPQVDEVSAGIDGTRYALDQLFKACANDSRCAGPIPICGLSGTAPSPGWSDDRYMGWVTVDAGKLLRAARFALGGDGPANLTMVAGDDRRSSPWPARSAAGDDRGERSAVLFRVSALVHQDRRARIQSRRLSDRAVSRRGARSSTRRRWPGR